MTRNIRGKLNEDQRRRRFRKRQRLYCGESTTASCRNSWNETEQKQMELLVTESSGSDMEIEPSCTRLEDLPESCIAFILSMTTPEDAARLACVNSIFWAASSSDFVWHRMLPLFYLNILAQALDAPASTSPKKEIYNFLTRRVVLENGTQDFWLDRATGGVCRSIGARGLQIVSSENPHLWKWTKREGSRYDEVANLLQIDRLEVNGNLQCGYLPPGIYTLSWRLSFSFGKPDFQGFRDNPVIFDFQRTGREEFHFINVLTSSSRIPRHLKGHFRPVWRDGDAEQWIEIDVGEFTVKEGDLPVELSFSMKETSSIWKSGLFLDNVFMRPKSVRVKEKLQIFKRAYSTRSRSRYSRLAHALRRELV